MTTTMPTPRSPSPPSPVLHVVVTGGGCSGKTSTMALVAARLRAGGATVMCVEEPVTALVRDTGLDLGTLDAASFAGTQRNLVVRSRDNRWYARRVCAAMTEVQVVLYDRAELDGVPYTAAGTVDAVLGEQGETLDDALRAYWRVFILGSSEAGYETDSNEARYESVDVAMRQGDALTRAWSVHPRAQVVAWQTTPAGKADAILRVLEQDLRG